MMSDAHNERPGHDRPGQDRPDPAYRHPDPDRPAEHVEPPGGSPWPAAKLLGVLGLLALIVLIAVMLANLF